MANGLSSMSSTSPPSGYPLERVHARECDRIDRDNPVARRMKRRRTNDAQGRPHTWQAMTRANRGEAVETTAATGAGKDTATGVGGEP